MIRARPGQQTNTLARAGTMSNATAANFYEILQCSENATFEQLKCKYKQLILQCHPDKLPDPTESVSSSSSSSSSSKQPPNDEESFIRINAAWNTLKDPIKRKLYDAELCQNRFQLHNNIFDRLRLTDLEIETCADDDGAVKTIKTYRCRCGGQYIVDDETEIPTTNDDEVLIECTECSLVVVLRR